MLLNYMATISISSREDSIDTRLPVKNGRF